VELLLNQKNKSFLISFRFLSDFFKIFKIRLQTFQFYQCFFEIVLILDNKSLHFADVFDNILDLYLF
jgi:hypothetical protein